MLIPQELQLSQYQQISMIADFSHLTDKTHLSDGFGGTKCNVAADNFFL